MGKDHAEERIAWTSRKLVSRLKQKKNWDLDDFLVIGIDFGTTYSGAAWASNTEIEEDHINVVTSWPGTGHEEGKVPTEIFYEHDQMTWGYEIPCDAEPIRWFKLLLLRNEDISAEVSQSDYLIRSRRAVKDSGKSAAEIVANYLRLLWKHILRTITKARGSNIVDAMRLHVVITVPAIWKSYCRLTMTKALQQAGILKARPAGQTTHSFAPEPEAAAIATFLENRTEVGIGDVYIVCDAGGGTVDLTTYEVDKNDPISLCEAVVGTGGLCGGVFIDEAFESICKARLGRKWSALSSTGIRKVMKAEWEYSIKPSFKMHNSVGKEFIVSIPAEAFKDGDRNDRTRAPHIRNGRIHFSSSDIEESFTAVIRNIADLIDNQIQGALNKNKAVNGIMLVGGFGSSPYLFEYLQDRYEDIDILQSPGSMKPRTAICCGAVLKGFMDAPAATEADEDAATLVSSISIISTIARFSVGLPYYQRYDKSIHNAEDRAWSDREDGWVVEDVMSWFLHKGDNISKLRPVEIKFHRLYYYDEKSEGVEICEEFFENTSDKLPLRFDSAMNKLCTIRGTFCDSVEELDDWLSPKGKRRKKASYTVKMMPSGASVEFSVYYRGKRIGSESVSVKF